MELSSLLSLGFTTSYKSIIGPINLDASWVNEINQFRFFVGIGIPLNRSN